MSALYVKALKILILLLAVGLSGYGLYIGLTTPGLKPVVISPYEKAVIHPVERVAHLGKIPMDDKVRHTFRLYNTGGQRLQIHAVEPSCGCTVARLSQYDAKPGDFVELEVELDTSIKLGPVEKTITVKSNDPVTPELALVLTGDVQFNLDGHGRMAVKDPLVLFQGECAQCHVNRGKGKTGQALFQADCAMCHGLNAEGAVAMGLLSGDFHEEAHIERLRRVITEGSPNTPTMPPFGEAHGGPLNADEIESLINYLRYQKATSAARDASEAGDRPGKTGPHAQ